MTRLLCFAVTIGAMGLSAAAHAESFSFTVGGHHISINTARSCYSAACVSVSIPGIVAGHHRHSDSIVAAQDAAPGKAVPRAGAAIASAPAVAPAPVAASAPVPQIVPTASPAEPRVAVAPATPPSPPPAPKLAATGGTEVAAPPPPSPPAEPAKTTATEAPAAPPPSAQPALDKSPIERPAQAMPATPPAAAIPSPGPAPVPKAAEAVDTERDDSPLGDWQTAGKTGAVRIEACGKALCGYLINPSSHAKAEAILISMKPRVGGKSNRDLEWRGSIFSRASGNTYNATMTLHGANLLRVEACALGHFFCSGNDWTRIVKQPAALATSRDGETEPRS
jgi:uncharacterized protein (DUF2147 family)